MKGNYNIELKVTTAGPMVSYKIALVALAVLYFMMGFITVLNDTLVPFFKRGFDLTYSQSSFVQLYFYLSYGLISIPAGRLIGRMGYKKGMVIGFLIASFGALLFYPASLLHEYRLFLGALFVIAIGIVMLQVSANPYITSLGKPETAASRLTLIQGVGSLGTTLAPLFGGYFILSGVHESTGSSALVFPYLGIAVTLFVIGAIVWKMKLPTIMPVQQDRKAKRIPIWELIKRHPNLAFGLIALFMYVGAEVGIGTYLTNYIAEKLHIEEHLANFYLSFYWGGMLIGRFVGVYFLKIFTPQRVLAFVGGLAILLLLISVSTEGYLSVWTVVSIGLCNSIMFATIFSLSVKGLGNHTGEASGLLSTAIVGGAVLSYLLGHARDFVGWDLVFCIPVVCYLIILFYGLKGHRERTIPITQKQPIILP